MDFSARIGGVGNDYGLGEEREGEGGQEWRMFL
jgi:hypothetical protein